MRTAKIKDKPKSDLGLSPLGNLAFQQTPPTDAVATHKKVLLDLDISLIDEDPNQPGWWPQIHPQSQTLLHLLEL